MKPKYQVNCCVICFFVTCCFAKYETIIGNVSNESLISYLMFIHLVFGSFLPCTFKCGPIFVVFTFLCHSHTLFNVDEPDAYAISFGKVRESRTGSQREKQRHDKSKIDESKDDVLLWHRIRGISLVNSLCWLEEVVVQKSRSNPAAFRHEWRIEAPSYKYGI